jgi:hypothetical protein
MTHAFYRRGFGGGLVSGTGFCLLAGLLADLVLEVPVSLVLCLERAPG